jgi:Flp pilus assembly protein RcpC/CpaB
MATRKSTPVILIGVAVFVVGAGLAFVLLRNNKTSTPKATHVAASPTAPTPSNAIVGGSTSPTGAVVAYPIPAGRNAVAVQVPALNGLDGFAKAGDVVNIFATVSKGRLNLPGLAPPEVKLVVSNVPVLQVLAPAPAAAPTGSATYLLALDPEQAEQVIFFTTYESLYFTLVPKNSPPVLTPGHSYQNATF